MPKRTDISKIIVPLIGRGLWAAVLLVFSNVIMGFAQDWSPVDSPLCGRLKVKGANVSNRSYTIYEAQNVNVNECCEGMTLKSQGRTKRFGYFEVTGALPSGHYFAVFNLKDSQIKVPLDVQRSSVGIKDCGSESVLIEKDRKTGKVTVQSFVTVD